MSLKKIPTKTLQALISAQYCYSLVLRAALEDIPNLPRAPFEQACALAEEQLRTLIAAHATRTNESKTQKMLEKVIESVQPQPPTIETQQNV